MKLDRARRRKCVAETCCCKCGCARKGPDGAVTRKPPPGESVSHRSAQPPSTYRALRPGRGGRGAPGRGAVTAMAAGGLGAVALAPTLRHPRDKFSLTLLDRSTCCASWRVTNSRERDLPFGRQNQAYGHRSLHRRLLAGCGQQRLWWAVLLSRSAGPAAGSRGAGRRRPVRVAGVGAVTTVLHHTFGSIPSKPCRCWRRGCCCPHPGAVDAAASALAARRAGGGRDGRVVNAIAAQ